MCKFTRIDDGSKACGIIHLLTEACKLQLMKSSIPHDQCNIYMVYNLIHSLVYVIVHNRNMEMLYICISDFMGMYLENISV